MALGYSTEAPHRLQSSSFKAFDWDNSGNHLNFVSYLTITGNVSQWKRFEARC